MLPHSLQCASRNPHECAVAKNFRCVSRCCRGESQPARMRCGKGGRDGIHLRERTRRNPHECAVAKIMSARCAALVTVSQPARMRCGKVAPLLCPNRKLREHELRSSFLVSPPVILVVTFYMTAQLLKRFNRVQQKPPHQNCPMRRCILLISEPVSTEPAGIVGLFPLALCKIILNKFDWVIWQGLSTLFELSDAYRLSDFLLPLCCHETAAW